MNSCVISWALSRTGIRSLAALIPDQHATALRYLLLVYDIPKLANNTQEIFRTIVRKNIVTQFQELLNHRVAFRGEFDDTRRCHFHQPGYHLIEWDISSYREMVYDRQRQDGFSPYPRRQSAPFDLRPTLIGSWISGIEK